MTAQAATLLLGLLLGAGDDAGKRDLKAMQGAWRTVSVEINGKKLEKGFATDRMTIRGSRFEMKAGKDTMAGTIKLDGTKDPGHINTEILEGANKGLKSVGIYYLKDDRLIVCYCVAPNPRPNEFRTAEGTSRALVVYERVKQ